MKPFIHTAFAFVASLVFLSCNDMESSKPLDDYKEPPCKELISGWVDSSCEENKQKRLVWVTDTYMEPLDEEYIGGSIVMSSELDPESGNIVFVVNGEKMSEKEYVALIEERTKRRNEELSKKDKKRDLTISCARDVDERRWLALLTDEEIAELMENYKELSIYDCVPPAISP